MGKKIGVLTLMFRVELWVLFKKERVFWSGNSILTFYLWFNQATLGFGKATNRSILQCNVGDRSPVYLCSLYPEKSESLQLNLEFEEVDEVIFSVVGPWSIHLSGYYLGRGRNPCLNDESYPFVGLRHFFCMNYIFLLLLVLFSYFIWFSFYHTLNCLETSRLV